MSSCGGLSPSAERAASFCFVWEIVPLYRLPVEPTRTGALARFAESFMSAPLPAGIES